ncbi:MAG TPA: prolipoprotein diacylglyceryl transferase [Ktedonosporobacter sp.]|nr:prolipoprotein diacylglyceryl transferase [Ktedonosporobacter sp.]
MYPPLNPILVQFGPLAIRWYGLTMTSAIVLGALVASRYVARKGQDGNTIWDMLLWVLVPALIGARLYFVFIQSPRTGPDGLPGYLSNPIKIVEIWQGGIHIYGAFILGGLALLLYLRWRKLPPLIFLDGVGLGLLLGQAIGRIGNFINQELYGPPTTLPWGLRIDQAHRISAYTDMTKYPDSVRFHPLFLYEMVWDALGFAFLFWISRRFEKHLRDGDLFLLYLIWAPLGRFFLEFLRTDSWFFPGTPFNPVHLLTAGAVITASVLLLLRFRHRQSQAQTTSDTSNETTGTNAVGTEG